ncbi:hypothetical protein D3C76_817680 [compost metagenome]
MLGGAMIGLGLLGLAAQLGLGLLLLPAGGGLLSRSIDEQLYWQFLFLVPSLPLAFGCFLLRYRVRRLAHFHSERVNCAAFLLISAGVSLVLGKLVAILTI